MKVYSLYLTYKNIIRLKEILAVFLKYGFSNLIENTDLKKFIPFYKRFFKKKMRRYVKGGMAVQLRMAFEELGPTFIKFGQMLSRRDDLLSEEFIEQLSMLEDNVTPTPFQEIDYVIKKTYQDTTFPFEFIDVVPKASASVAQVHEAKLKNGLDVVLKVKRPGIDAIIQDDLVLLKFLGKFFEKHFTEFSYLKLSEIISEFEKTIKKELNFKNEIGNMEKMRNIFSDVPYVVIPKAYLDISKQDIIVMENIKSLKLVDIETFSKFNIDTPKLLKSGLKAFLRKLFRDGVFHGDLHMGNIGVTYDGKIVLYDFGNIGFLSKSTRELIKTFLMTFVDKNYMYLVEKLIELDFVVDEKHIAGLEKEFMDCFEYRMGLTIKQLDLPGLIKDLIEICRNHKINLPSELAGFFRTILYIDTIGKTSIPNFALGELISELFEENVLSNETVGDAIKNSLKTLNDFKNIAAAFPGKVDKLIRKMLNDKFIVDFYHMNLEPLTDEMKKSSNRISVSLIVSALIIGSSLVFFSDKGPHLFGYPMLGIFGFIVSFVLGVYLLIGIIRSGRL